MFKKLKELFSEKPVKLWCGYYGNLQYLHMHQEHETIETPEDAGHPDVKIIKQRRYCHQMRTYEERDIHFTRAK